MLDGYIKIEQDALVILLSVEQDQTVKIDQISRMFTASLIEPGWTDRPEAWITRVIQSNTGITLTLLPHILIYGLL